MKNRPNIITPEESACIQQNFFLNAKKLPYLEEFIILYRGILNTIEAIDEFQARDLRCNKKTRKAGLRTRKVTTIYGQTIWINEINESSNDNYEMRGFSVYHK